MDNLRMTKYQWKGDKFDLEILQNMLDLWSPYITLEDITMDEPQANPSHHIAVSYDFTPLRKEYNDKKIDSNSLYSLGWRFTQYVKLYPLMKNLDLNIQEAREAVSYGVSDKPIEFKEGHYYMGGGGSPLVVYIDEANAEEDYYTMYVLNLWATFKGPAMLNTSDDFKGQSLPWFNLYRVNLRKLKSDFKIDITDWINGFLRVSFMNWDSNPL